MAGMTGYVGYCTLQFEISFSNESRGNNNKLYSAELAIDTPGVIWAMYPSDGSDGNPEDRFCITTSSNTFDPPTQAVPVTSLALGNVVSSSAVTFTYDPTLDTQGTGGTFYFTTYLWGNAIAIKNTTVSFTATINGNATITTNGNEIDDGTPVSVDWSKKS